MEREQAVDCFIKRVQQVRRMVIECGSVMDAYSQGHHLAAPGVLGSKTWQDSGNGHVGFGIP